MDSYLFFFHFFSVLEFLLISKATESPLPGTTKFVKQIVLSQKIFCVIQIMYMFVLLLLLMS